MAASTFDPNDPDLPPLPPESKDSEVNLVILKEQAKLLRKKILKLKSDLEQAEKEKKKEHETLNLRLDLQQVRLESAQVKLKIYEAEKNEDKRKEYEGYVIERKKELEELRNDIPPPPPPSDSDDDKDNASKPSDTNLPKQNAPPPATKPEKKPLKVAQIYQLKVIEKDLENANEKLKDAEARLKTAEIAFNKDKDNKPLEREVNNKKIELLKARLASAEIELRKHHVTKDTPQIEHWTAQITQIKEKLSPKRKASAPSPKEPLKTTVLGTPSVNVEDEPDPLHEPPPPPPDDDSEGQEEEPSEEKENKEPEVEPPKEEAPKEEPEEAPKIKKKKKRKEKKAKTDISTSTDDWDDKPTIPNAAEQDKIKAKMKENFNELMSPETPTPQDTDLNSQPLVSTPSPPIAPKQPVQTAVIVTAIDEKAINEAIKASGNKTLQKELEKANRKLKEIKGQLTSANETNEKTLELSQLKTELSIINIQVQILDKSKNKNDSIIQFLNLKKAELQEKTDSKQLEILASKKEDLEDKLTDEKDTSKQEALQLELDKIELSIASLKIKILVKRTDTDHTEEIELYKMKKTELQAKIKGNILDSIVEKFGDYEIGGPGGEGVGGPAETHERVKSILGEGSKAQSRLYEVDKYERQRSGMLPHAARRKFVQALLVKMEEDLTKGIHKVRSPDKPEGEAITWDQFLGNEFTVGEDTIKLEKFLGTKLMELYIDAVKEEANSIEFRDAVFLSSTTAYERTGGQKREPFVLWVAGPSGAGKTTATKKAVETITNSKQTKKPGQLFDPDNEDLVVSVDGGVEREISQIRQLVLQAALKSGYKGIEDLQSKTEDATDSKIKKKVKKAAIAANLSIAIPSTFGGIKDQTQMTSPFDKVIKKYQKETPNRKLYFSEVIGEPGEEGAEKFQKTIEGMGESRAWMKKGTHEDIFRTNNVKIGCESKKYKKRGFTWGRRGSANARKIFLEKFPNAYYSIQSDLMYARLVVEEDIKEAEARNLAIEKRNLTIKDEKKKIPKKRVPAIGELITCEPSDDGAKLMSNRKFYYWNDPQDRSDDPEGQFIPIRNNPNLTLDQKLSALDKLDDKGLLYFPQIRPPIPSSKDDKVIHENKDLIDASVLEPQERDRLPSSDFLSTEEEYQPQDTPEDIQEDVEEVAEDKENQEEDTLDVVPETETKTESESESESETETETEIENETETETESEPLQESTLAEDKPEQESRASRSASESESESESESARVSPSAPTSPPSSGTFYEITPQQGIYGAKKILELGQKGISKNEENMKSVRVFVPDGLLTPEQLNGGLDVPGSLARLLTMHMDKVTSGDKYYEKQDGTEITDARRMFKRSDGTEIPFSQIPYGPPPDKETLSPQERMLATRIIVATKCTIRNHGGYKSAQVPYQPAPITGIAIGRAAPQLEMDYLEYRHFIVDKKAPRRNDVAQGDIFFAKRYLGEDTGTNGFPTYEEASLEISRGSQDYIDLGNERLLNKKAYLAAMKEAIMLELTAANEMAREAGQDKIHHKATFAGIGFFANLLDNKNLNIGNQLSPIITQAFREILEEDAQKPASNRKLSHIGSIGFPTFDENAVKGFNQTFKENNNNVDNIGGVKIIEEPGVDVLNNQNSEGRMMSFNIAGDAFSAKGNEYGRSSVEAAIGENTDIGISCLPAANPELLKKTNIITVSNNEGLRNAFTGQPLVSDQPLVSPPIVTSPARSASFESKSPEIEPEYQSTINELENQIHASFREYEHSEIEFKRAKEQAKNANQLANQHPSAQNREKLKHARINLIAKKSERINAEIQHYESLLQLYRYLKPNVMFKSGEKLYQPSEEVISRQIQLYTKRLAEAEERGRSLYTNAIQFDRIEDHIKQKTPTHEASGYRVPPQETTYTPAQPQSQPYMVHSGPHFEEPPVSAMQMSTQPMAPMMFPPVPLYPPAPNYAGPPPNYPAYPFMTMPHAHYFGPGFPVFDISANFPGHYQTMPYTANMRPYNPFDFMSMQYTFHTAKMMAELSQTLNIIVQQLSEMRDLFSTISQSRQPSQGQVHGQRQEQGQGQAFEQPGYHPQTTHPTSPNSGPKPSPSGSMKFWGFDQSTTGNPPLIQGTDPFSGTTPNQPQGRRNHIPR